MLPHRPQDSHVSRQQQSLFYDIGHVSSLSLLEVLNGSVVKYRSSVQHYGGDSSWNFNMVVTPSVHNSSLIGGSCLCDPSMFAPSLWLGFLGWKVLPLLHHLLSLLVSFPLFFSRVKLGNLSKRKNGEFGMECLFRHVAPNMGLQQV